MAKRVFQKYSRGQTIIHRQEELAIRLLDRALMRREDAVTAKNEPPIDVQLDVFAKVGQWVAVKNRLEEQGEESRLEQFKRRINADAGEAAQKRAYQAGGDTALRRLQARLPDRGPSGADGNSDGAVGEDPAAA